MGNKERKGIIIGATFSRLRLEEFNGKGRATFCCDCGKKKLLMIHNVSAGRTKSCGCLRMESTSLRNKTHGEPKSSPEYMAWANMMQRCTNDQREDYERYGGRGISVYPKWIGNFPAFLEHIGRRPGRGYSLDRWPNNNGNYEPGNVRWATIIQQAANKRKRRWLRNPLNDPCVALAAKSFKNHKERISAVIGLLFDVHETSCSSFRGGKPCDCRVGGALRILKSQTPSRVVT